MDSKKLLHVVLLVLICLMNQAALSEIIKTSNGTGADAYISYTGGNTNYGGMTYLMVSKNYVPYLKFDLSIAGPNNIADANLTLYGTPDPGFVPSPFTTSFYVFGLLEGSDAWDESMITYNNAPLVTNPITWNPNLVLLGTLNYTEGDQGAITMVKNGTEFVKFLNNRGPDNAVTIILASGNYTDTAYFSTKEDHGDASEAPYVSITMDSAVVQRNNWTGTDSNSWSNAANWMDENSSTSIPDGNAVVNIVSGANYPIIIDSNASAKKVFVHGGDLKITSNAILTITDGVLRVKDGQKVDILDGQINLAGNVEGRIWALIAKGKIVTSNVGQVEVYPQYDANNATTVVTIRDMVQKLKWGRSIVDANAPTGDAGTPIFNAVNGKGLIGETHIGFIDGVNSYYGRNLESMGIGDVELKFMFDRAYNLTDMYVWNYEDKFNGYGLQNVRIEYSTDDVTYTTLMNDGQELFVFKQGSIDCNKSDIVSFGGVSAKFVKVTAVGGAGSGNWEGTLLGRYILKELQFCITSMEAYNPSPTPDKQVDLASSTQLKWDPGQGTVTGQDVWFGTAPGAMTKIGANLAPETNSINITVQSGNTYYWRVDGLNTGGSTTTGFVWSFSIRDWLHWNPAGQGVVYAYGSPGSGGSPGTNAANESGITGDLHAAFLNSNGWYSRKPWDVGITEPELLVKFDKAYDINEMWVWNHDGVSSSEAPMALKTIEIKYSLDDVSYTTLMNGAESTFILPHGNTNGTHDTAIKFDVPARYVKIKAVGGPGIGNYGSTTWGYKLREVRFYQDSVYKDEKASYPYPEDGKEVDIFIQARWTPSALAVSGQDIYLGKVGGSLELIASNIDPDTDSFLMPQLDNFSDYVWRVDGRNGEVVTQGDEWNFSTHARLRWNPGLIGVIDANGSKGDGGTYGYLAANESGLTYDMHDTFSTSNSWYCRNPGTLQPPLLITFDRVYDVNEMWIWNHDGTSTSEAPTAVKTIKVEYSLDNVSYTTLMNGTEPNFVLPHGNVDGTHDTEINFGDSAAKYVKITPVGGIGVGNYGSTYGYKLREVRFFYQVPLWADLNNDKKVNFEDYCLMAEGWLEENWIYDPIKYCQNKPVGDVTGDCKVDYLDIDVLAGEWLEDIN